jgi:protein TonB
MDKNSNFFYLSGLLSISLFFFFLFSFIYLLFSNQKVNSFALKKDNYISVSMDFTDFKNEPIKQKDQTIEQKNNPSLSSSSDASANIAEQKDVSIDSMFSNVWTKDVKAKKQKEEKEQTQRVQDIPKKTKKVEANSVASVSEVIEQFNTQPQANSSQNSTSSAEEVNEYIAIIHAKVYQHFIPPQNSQGYSVEAVIELSAIGNLLDFRILRYSDNSALNDECDKLKERLRRVLFPKNPKNTAQRFTIILKSKE